MTFEEYEQHAMSRYVRAETLYSTSTRITLQNHLEEGNNTADFFRSIMFLRFLGFKLADKEDNR